MHVEGVAFFTSRGRPGYAHVTFTDQSPAAAYGFPVALVRGRTVAGGHEHLVRAVLAGSTVEVRGTVAVYVGPETTDLEITFLWNAGFRARKVRRPEVVATGRHWTIVACRHFAEVAGLLRRSRQRGGVQNVTGRCAGVRAGAADGARDRGRPRRREGPRDRGANADERGAPRRPGVA